MKILQKATEEKTNQRGQGGRTLARTREEVPPRPR